MKPGAKEVTSWSYLKWIKEAAAERRKICSPRRETWVTSRNLIKEPWSGVTKTSFIQMFFHGIRR
jgi:hypothetical protein